MYIYIYLLYQSGQLQLSPHIFAKDHENGVQQPLAATINSVSVCKIHPILCRLYFFLPGKSSVLTVSSWLIILSLGL